MEKLQLTIGYDAKRAVRNDTGLGNYSRLVMASMASMYPKNKYVAMAPELRDNPRLEPLRALGNVEFFTPDGPVTSRLRSWWRTVEMVHDWPRLGLDLYHGLSNEIPLTSNLAPVPTVVTIHDLIWRRVPQDYPAIDRRLYDLKYGRSARIATRIIAISECTKRDLVSDWHIDPAKIDVIYQGCDPSFSRPVSFEEKEAVRKRFNLPQRYIITVGTVQSRKNQLLAVKALPALPDDVKLVIVGRGEKRYKAEVLAEIERLRVGDRVIWLEGVDFQQLPALYAAAELSSYTSRYEGFGLPIIESLSAGTPVVACTGSCLEEAGGKGGVYVAPDDVAGYADAARGILEKRYFHDRLAGDGRKHVAKFNPSNFASEMMKTYNKAILDYNIK